MHDLDDPSGYDPPHGQFLLVILALILAIVCIVGWATLMR